MGIRHIEACQILGVKIIGLFDLNDKAVAAAKERYSLAHVAIDSIDELLNHDIDIAVIATTADSHFQYVDLCAKAQIKYIFCEKPMSVSVDQCHMMLEICEDHGSHLAINHCHRFNPLYQTLRQHIENNAIGQVASVNIVTGNIGLAMNGSHFFEIFRVLTGELPLFLSAELSRDPVPNPRGTHFMDHAGIVNGMTKSGIKFTLNASNQNGHGIQLIIAGSDGHIYCDVLAGYIRVTSRKSEHKGLPTNQYAMPATVEEIHMGPSDIVDMTTSMLSALLKNDNYFSGKEGLYIVQLLACAYHSHDHTGCNSKPDDLDDAYNSRVFAWA